MKKNKIILLSILLILSALMLSSCSGSSTMNNSTSWPGISSDGKTVYSAYNTYISAVNGGTKVWNYPESAEKELSFYAAPLIDGDKVYAVRIIIRFMFSIKRPEHWFKKSCFHPWRTRYCVAGIADGLLLISSSDETVMHMPFLIWQNLSGASSWPVKSGHPSGRGRRSVCCFLDKN